MRLRNKKSGEIMNFRWYHSLAEINEDWEVYMSKEPLIKDKKIRKAVRAWAGCNLLDDNDKVFLSKPTFDCKILSLEHGMLNFDVYYDDESLCNKHYTITELCGEEE